jgi:hypothetical protein
LAGKRWGYNVAPFDPGVVTFADAFGGVVVRTADEVTARVIADSDSAERAGRFAAHCYSVQPKPMRGSPTNAANAPTTPLEGRSR